MAHGKKGQDKAPAGKAALRIRRARCAAFARGRLARLEARAGGRFRRRTPLAAVSLRGGRPGYDPELLYVECGRCGAPVLWEPGRATRLLDQAGIDPLELDASCLLVTNACPMCGTPEAGEGATDGPDGEPGYEVRVFRVGGEGEGFGSPRQGHA